MAVDDTPTGQVEAALDEAGKGQEARRLNDALQILQLVTKSLDALPQDAPGAICETVLSVSSAFAQARAAVAMLVGDNGRFDVVSALGVTDTSALSSPEAQTLLRELCRAGTHAMLQPDELRARWPAAPAWLLDGFSAVPVDSRDSMLGLLLYAGRLAQDSDHQDGPFLSVVGAITGFALGRASAHGARPTTMPDAEPTALEPPEVLERELIERQRTAIDELSTPILQLWDNVIALPIIGVVDSRRSLAIMERLLSEISARQSRYVILDITGVEVVDTKTADHFIKVVKAAELLGARCILTGIRPAVAQTLVDLGIDLSGVHTLRTLQDGLKKCLRAMGQSDMVSKSAARNPLLEAVHARRDAHPDHQALR